MTHVRRHRSTSIGASAGPRLLLTLFLLLLFVGASVDAQTQAPAEPGAPTTDADDGEEAEEREVEVAQEDDADEAPRWYERLRFSGDFRSRYEGFYRKESTTRNRTRLRLRLRLDVDVNDDIEFHLQTASGDPNNPVSTNQTFTGFFTPKAFNLDRAVIDYNPRAASALTLGLGKYGLPQTRTQMVFDDDLNVEGGFEQVAWNVTDGVDLTVVGLQTSVAEASRDADSAMFAGYGEVGFALGEHRIQVSVANYGWKNVDPIARAVAGPDVSANLTNELVRDEEGDVFGFASRFNVVDVITEATLQTGKGPLRLLAEYALNTRAANERDSGFWAEAEYGSAREVRAWAAGYTYGWIQQDVTLSPFIFSDIPGTNLQMHMTSTSWMLLPGLTFDTTLHFSKRLYLADTAVSNDWLTRVHLAAVIRF